jgi:2-polyprenyl-3-methyl-5-hydroxy-6-metoxy-1,4-benzoquinol methylase
MTSANQLVSKVHQTDTTQVTVACPLCGDTKFKFLFTKQGVNFVQCANDSLVLVNPQPRLSELLEVYDEYGENRQTSARKIELDLNRSYTAELKEIEAFRKLGRVLDVGASIGGFLNAARAAGWETVGVEPSTSSARYASEKLGLQVYADILENVELPPESFDVVTLWATLEHMPNPEEILTHVHKLVRPGGAVIITVPNWDSITVKLLGSKDHYVCRDHLFYFTPQTLGKLLEKVGFTVVQKRTIGFNPLTLVRSWRDAKKGETTSALPDAIYSNNIRRGERFHQRLVRKAYQVTHWGIVKLSLGTTLHIVAKKS